jgi:hypothetical protein
MSKQFHLSRVLICKCGEKMSGKPDFHKDGAKLYYYRCTNPRCQDKKYLRAEQFEKIVLDVVAKKFPALGAKINECKKRQKNCGVLLVEKGIAVKVNKFIPELKIQINYLDFLKTK